MDGYILNYPIANFGKLIESGIYTGEANDNLEENPGENQLLFFLKAPSLEGSNVMEVNPQLLKEMSKRLGLLYINEKEGGNVCFVTENETLRDEYKIGFVVEDVYHYTYGRWMDMHVADGHRVKNICIPYPQDQDVFWHYVNVGKEGLRNRYAKGE